MVIVAYALKTYGRHYSDVYVSLEQRLGGAIATNFFGKFMHLSHNASLQRLGVAISTEDCGKFTRLSHNVSLERRLVVAIVPHICRNRNVKASL